MFRADQIQLYAMSATNEVHVLFPSNLVENQLVYCEHSVAVVDSPPILSIISTTTSSTTTSVTNLRTASSSSGDSLITVSRHEKVKNFVKIQFHLKAASNENLVAVFFTLNCGNSVHVSPFFHPCLSKHTELSHLQTQLAERLVDLTRNRILFLALLLVPRTVNSARNAIQVSYDEQMVANAAVKSQRRQQEKEQRDLIYQQQQQSTTTQRSPMLQQQQQQQEQSISQRSSMLQQQQDDERPQKWARTDNESSVESSTTSTRFNAQQHENNNNMFSTMQSNQFAQSNQQQYTTQQQQIQQLQQQQQSMHDTLNVVLNRLAQIELLWPVQSSSPSSSNIIDDLLVTDDESYFS